MPANQDAWNKLLEQGYTPRSTQEPQQGSRGFFSNVAESIKQRAAKAQSMFQTFNRSQSTGLRRFGEAAATGVGIAGQVAGGVGDVLGEGVITAGKAVLDDDTEKEIADFVSSVGQSEPVQRFVGAWQDFEQERPFASSAISGAANIIGLTGTGAVGKAATAPLKSAVKTGARAIKEGVETSLPRVSSAVRAAGRIAGDVASSAGSQLLAMSPQTVRNIIDGKISEQAIKNLDRVAVATQVKESLDKALDELSGLGSEYDVIRSSGQRVIIPVGGRVNLGNNTLREFAKPLTDTLTEYGLSIDEAGRITRSIDSKPFDPQTINAIQDFVDTYGKTGELDANQFLNVRQAADRIASWDAKDRDLAESFVQTLRGKYDEIGKTQIQGLADLDAQFAPMRQELGMLKRDFLTAQGELRDDAFTKIANLTNKGREQVLERLEKYAPGITEQINILRAVEDIAKAEGIITGSYTRTGVIGLSAAGSPLAGAMAFILTHPKIAVPLLRGYGNIKRELQQQIEKIIEKIQMGDTLSKEEKQIFVEAIKTTTEEKKG